MTGIRITRVRRHPEDGYWIARVTPEGGSTVDVHCKYGSWFVEQGGNQREVIPRVAAAIQERVRRLERAEAEILSARRAAAAASGRCEARARNLAANPPASRVLTALQLSPGRVRGTALSLSRPASGPRSAD